MKRSPILAFALGAIGALALAQSSPFAVVGDTPVIDNQLTVGAQPQYQDPGAVVYHDGTFHMFHNGFTGWPAKVGVFHSTSSDGISWTASGDTPVLTEEALSYETFTLLASSALVEENGTWVLYFYTWDGQAGSSRSRIGRATAPGPSGPWTADAEPALEPGERDSWDGLAVRVPSVILDEDGYRMYYTGVDRLGGRNIGLATSADGIVWSKHDDPDTVSTELNQSDPVFGKGDDSAWDRFSVYQPRVQRTPDGWVMLYRGVSGNDNSGQLGIAVSDDGLLWRRHPDNPVLAASALAGGRAIWFADLLHVDGSYYLYFELGTGTKTEIYLATFEGTLAR